MDDRAQQIETLIRLIEANLDDTWLAEFHALRSGGYLPGGGAGSLNDWGPMYSEVTSGAWYSNLYQILRHLFDNNLASNRIDDCKSIKFRNNIRIIRCRNCGKSYQHPASFESHLALDFYRENLPRFAHEQRLTAILTANESFESKDVVEYRNWLAAHYELNDIKVYDFVSAKYVCPHCGLADCETLHDLYKVSTDISGQKHFRIAKRDAVWQDFEE